MGKSLQRTATAAGTLLFVVGLGTLFTGMYRIKRVAGLPDSPSRRERRAAMRSALAEAAKDPAFRSAMEREAEVWDVAAGGGLAEA